MANEFDFSRFLDAQSPVFEQVRRELAAGSKRSHWMWYIFPQLRGLGRSSTAQFYAIASLAEAKAYLRHPVLGSRLLDCTGLVNSVSGRLAHQIFGSPDDMKFHSSVTLFSLADPEAFVFQTALARYFKGVPDQQTISLLD